MLRAGTGPARTGPARKAGRLRTGWKAAFFALAGAAIVAGVAWALLDSRFLVVRSVQVTGTGKLVTRAQVLAAAKIPLGLPLIRVDGAAVAQRVEQLRQVQSAQVSKDWPDTVVISVRVRTPVFAVASRGGYAVIDRFGVAMRTVRRRPARLPLLTVARPGAAITPAAPATTAPAAPPATGPPVRSLRGSPAVSAAAAVLGELPPRIARQVRAVTAAGASNVSVRLADGVVIVWGDTGRARVKAKELRLLMRSHARLYDVSGAGTAVTRG
jgi:cell division protein FtsQ